MRLKIGAAKFDVRPSMRLFRAWFHWWLIPSYPNLVALAVVIADSKNTALPSARLRGNQ